jgi:hypothetical protein
MTMLEDLISVLTKYEKYELINSLTEWFEENGDSDYEPSSSGEEPLDEYLEVGSRPEQPYKTNVDDNGFHQLVFSDDDDV